MKPFDKEAAMQGAAVCTNDGRPVRILCFDCRCVDGPIIAICKDHLGLEQFGCFNSVGIAAGAPSKYDLRMCHDNYLDRLARGQYSPISAKPIAIPIKAGQIEFSGPLTRREEFAKAAMQGIMAANEAGIGHITATVAQWAVAVADALCAELDKTEQLNTK